MEPLYRGNAASLVASHTNSSRCATAAPWTTPAMTNGGGEYGKYKSACDVWLPSRLVGFIVAQW